MVDIRVSVLLASLATLSLLLQKRGASPLGFVALYYMYFSFGPVLLWYLGGEIYRGTVVDSIPHAVWGFTLAILGWWVADLVRRRRELSTPSSPSDASRYFAHWSSWTYDLIVWSVLVYGLGVGCTVLLRGATGDKLAAINAAGPFHYQFLLGMSLALCWTSSARLSSNVSRRLVAGAWLVFIFYCMVTAERDFLLVAFAIGIHLAGGRRNWRTVLAFVGVSLAAVLAGTAIFVRRAGERSTLSVADVLNQGSTLFIDTFIHDWILSGNPYPEESWLMALTRTNASEFGTLGQWFVAIFTGSPDANSAYGFSLSAEAFMNGGYIGVFWIFFVLGLVQLWLVCKARKSPLWNGSSVAFMYVVLYGIRGELYSLISACFAIVVLALVIRFGQRRRRARGQDTDSSKLRSRRAMATGPRI